MITLISCAKIMREDSLGIETLLDELSPLFATPKFTKEAQFLASKISKFTTTDLSKALKVNASIAEQTYQRYRDFGRGESLVLPAILSYNGIVFKNIDPKNLPLETIEYSNKHLLITSFLYGLSRPLDLIEPYRLEGGVVYEDGATIFSYWRDILTDYLIEVVEGSGGILCDLSSGEMKHLFHWERVLSRVRVITPQFRSVRGGVIKSVVVHTKIGRGLLSRYILEGCIDSLEGIQGFCLGGYRYVGGEFESVFVREY